LAEVLIFPRPAAAMAAVIALESAAFVVHIGAMTSENRLRSSQAACS
jgi:hypothetical protein